MQIATYNDSATLRILTASAAAPTPFTTNYIDGLVRDMVVASDNTLSPYLAF